MMRNFEKQRLKGKIGLSVFRAVVSKGQDKALVSSKFNPKLLTKYVCLAKQSPFEQD